MRPLMCTNILALRDWKLDFKFVHSTEQLHYADKGEYMIAKFKGIGAHIA